MSRQKTPTWARDAAGKLRVLGMTWDAIAHIVPHICRKNVSRLALVEEQVDLRKLVTLRELLQATQCPYCGTKFFILETAAVARCNHCWRKVELPCAPPPAPQPTLKPPQTPRGPKVKAVSPIIRRRRERAARKNRKLRKEDLKLSQDGKIGTDPATGSRYLLDPDHQPPPPDPRRDPRWHEHFSYLPWPPGSGKVMHCLPEGFNKLAWLDGNQPQATKDYVRWCSEGGRP